MHPKEKIKGANMHPKKYINMKRITIISIMMLLSASIFAQRKAYIDVCMQPWSIGKYLLLADFGRNDVESITEDDNPSTCKQFTSPMAGINFLASLGWHVIYTYQGIDLITKKSALHYILEKDIINESDIMKGISTKEEKKKEPKKYKFGKYGDDIY